MVEKKYKKCFYRDYDDDDIVWEHLFDVDGFCIFCGQTKELEKYER